MKHVQDSRFLSPLRLSAGKIHASRRSCEIERAGNANFATAGSAGKKKKKRQERKDPETAPWPVSITRLLWLRQWRTLFLAGRRSLRLPSSRGSSLLPASIRDGERNRTKGTSPIAPQRLPRHPRFLPVAPATSLYLPSFLLVLLRVPLVVSLPFLRSSRRANLLGRYVQIDSERVRGPCSRVPRYFILVASVVSVICILQLGCSVALTHIECLNAL